MDFKFNFECSNLENSSMYSDSEEDDVFECSSEDDIRMFECSSEDDGSDSTECNSSNELLQQRKFDHLRALMEEHQFEDGKDEEEYLQAIYRHHVNNNYKNMSANVSRRFKRLEDGIYSRNIKDIRKKSTKVYDNDNHSTELCAILNRSNISDLHEDVNQLKRVKYFYSKINKWYPTRKLNIENADKEIAVESALDRIRNRQRFDSRGEPANSNSRTWAHLENFLTIPVIILTFLCFLIVVESAGCRKSGI